MPQQATNGILFEKLYQRWLLFISLHLQNVIIWTNADLSRVKYTAWVIRRRRQAPVEIRKNWTGWTTKKQVNMSKKSLLSFYHLERFVCNSIFYKISLFSFSCRLVETNFRCERPSVPKQTGTSACHTTSNVNKFVSNQNAKTDTHKPVVEAFKAGNKTFFVGNKLLNQNNRLIFCWFHIIQTRLRLLISPSTSTTIHFDDLGAANDNAKTWIFRLLGTM